MVMSRPGFADTLHRNNKEPRRNPWVKFGTLGTAAVLAIGATAKVAPETSANIMAAYDWVTYEEPIGQPVIVPVNSEGAIAAVREGVNEIHNGVNTDGKASNDFELGSVQGITEAGQRIEDEVRGPIRPGTKITVSIVDPRFGSPKAKANLNQPQGS